MKAATVLAVLVLVFLAGCVDETATTIAWEVRNDSSEPIAYTLILEGSQRATWRNGTASAGGVQHHEMATTATDLVATAQLRDRPRDSAGVPFALDGLCSGYRVVATWDGQGWAVDAAASGCA